MSELPLGLSLLTLISADGEPKMAARVEGLMVEDLRTLLIVSKYYGRRSSPPELS